MFKTIFKFCTSTLMSSVYNLSGTFVITTNSSFYEASSRLECCTDHSFEVEFCWKPKWKHMKILRDGDLIMLLVSTMGIRMWYWMTSYQWDNTNDINDVLNCHLIEIIVLYPSIVASTSLCSWLNKKNPSHTQPKIWLYPNQPILGHLGPVL